MGALSASDSQKHDSWQFNLRESNTEPLLRLNVETIGDEDLLLEKTTKISRNLKALAVGEKRNFGGNLKNLLEKCEFELFFHFF